MKEVFEGIRGMLHFASRTHVLAYRLGYNDALDDMAAFTRKNRRKVE